MGLPLPEAGKTQTVYPGILFMYTAVILSPSTVHGSFDWVVPATLVDPLVLTDQVSSVPVFERSTLSEVFSSPLDLLIFLEAAER